MDVTTLRYFLTVADEGSITRAAHVLSLTQPTLSRRMADLEQEMGCPLLERESRGVTLTAEGRILRQRAEELVTLADRTKTEVGAEHAAIAGDVRLGAGETTAMRAVAAVMREMLDEHPGVAFHVTSGSAETIDDLLARGLLDFGLFVEALPPRGYESITLAQVSRYGALMPEDSPLARQATVSADDLRGHQLILPRPRRGATALDGIADPAAGPHSTCSLPTNATFMVRAGLGTALCLDGLVGAEGTGLAFRPLDPPRYVDAHLAWKGGPAPSRACGEFRRRLMAAFA